MAYLRSLLEEAEVFSLSLAQALAISGFLPFALVTSSLTHKDSPFLYDFIANVLGAALVFVGGILGLQFFGGLDFSKSVEVGLTPFIPPGLIKIVAITIISIPILRV